MQDIIIVSDDICVIKQIVNTINKIKKFNLDSIFIYSIDDFKNYIYSAKFRNSSAIYFIDIYDIEFDFLEIINHIKDIDWLSKIIVLNTNSKLKSLLQSQKNIYTYLEKDINFINKLSEILLLIENDGEYKINISNLEIPVTLNKRYIENIYKLPSQHFSVCYNNGNNNLLISFDNVTSKIRNISENRIYTGKYEIQDKKRTYYSEPLKQFLVDLHLIYDVDHKLLSKLFNIDANYIKKWSNLSKYNRKFNFLKFIIGKLIIKSYLKK